MHYIAIATFSPEPAVVKEIVSRRRAYQYPAGIRNVQSYLDVQGGRAIVHFEAEDGRALLCYTADWPELTFDLFPVVPTETAWEVYLGRAS
jgi:hypothetical protein